jgi:hypothetical protein
MHVAWLLDLRKFDYEIAFPVEPFSAVKIGTVEFSPVPRSI